MSLISINQEITTQAQREWWPTHGSLDFYSLKHEL
jgi:hypothetical protein